MYRKLQKAISGTIPKGRLAAIVAPLLVLAFAIYTFAPPNTSVATGPSKSFPNVTIKNFGQMDDHFYRGAQPNSDEYKELAALGVKVIIDLRDDPMPFAKSATEEAKMRYFNIAMSDKDYPKNNMIDEFLNIAKEE